MTLYFTKRDRYVRAIHAINRNPRLEMSCYGRVLDCQKWYVEFERIEPFFVAAYSPNQDATFILKNDGNTVTVVGWYYGEPDEEATKYYQGKLTAVFNGGDLVGMC